MWDSMAEIEENRLRDVRCLPALWAKSSRCILPT
jgi:hypothetical protein